MEDEDNVGRADCTPSLSLSISLSLTLPLSVAIPVPRCACGGAARRRGPAAGMRGKSKGVKSMGATGKMFEYPAATGRAQTSKRRRERQVINVRGTRALDRSFGGRAPRRGGKRRGGGKGRWGAGGGGTVAVLSNVAVASWPENCPGHAWEDTGI